MTDLEQRLQTALDVLSELSDAYRNNEGSEEMTEALDLSSAIITSLMEQCR